MCVQTSDDDHDDEDGDGNDRNSGAIEMLLMHRALQGRYATSEREGRGLCQVLMGTTEARRTEMW